MLFARLPVAELADIDTRIRHMREVVLPLTEHESKALFRHYCRRSGLLSRKQRESMKQYVSRRRCQTFLVQVDLRDFSE